MGERLRKRANQSRMMGESSTESFGGKPEEAFEGSFPPVMGESLIVIVQNVYMAHSPLCVHGQDDGTVIDPTNADGDLEDFAPWLLPGALRLPVATVPTILSRINEPVRDHFESSRIFMPFRFCTMRHCKVRCMTDARRYFLQPKGRDTNVCADYVDGEVIFSLERGVSAGEEFYLDYGPMYERSGYGGGSGSLGTGVYPSDS
jgi:hypothetical protein